jgi:membrane-associated phospholipid phosphatase
VRDHLRWTEHGGAAVTLSNVGAYAVAPLVSGGLLLVAAGEQGEPRRIGVDLLITAEAVALAGTLNQLVKYTVGRQRPYAHAGVPNPDTRQGPDDANLSFYSAHTSVTFSLAAAAGTVARLRGSRWAPVIYIAGAAIGATTAYLRIAADQHYLTDVVTGAVVGTTVGIVVPYYFHRPRDWPARTSFIVAPMTIAGGRGFGCTLIW